MSDPEVGHSLSRTTHRELKTEKMPRDRPLADQASINSSSSDDSDASQEAQLGVQRLEAVASTWSKWSLIAAYAGVYLMAYAVSLEGQVTTVLTPVATSSFGAHSLVSTVSVVQSIILSVVKPPMSKIADVFGRLEAYAISVFLFTIGYIMSAGANSVQTYAAAQIFYSSGSTGVQILQQIFIADTSDLLNRAIFSTIPDIPYLINVWIGSPIANAILEYSSWRWGYGIWAIVLPLAFLPLALALFLNQRKAAKRGILPPSPYRGQPPAKVTRSLWFELDFFGLLLLSAAISLILIPLTIASSAKGGWSNPRIIAMLIIGITCLGVFPFWERSPRLAPHAFIPRALLSNRTALAGVAIAFFYFMAFYLSVFPYFLSYLLVVHNQSYTAAGHITQTFTFTATVTSIILGFIIKYTKHYKYFVTAGACIYMIGLGLMVRYRQQDVPTVTLVACQILLGIGGSLIHVPAQLGVQASATHSEVAAATAVFLTFLEIGGAVGSSISGAIWTNSLLPKLEAYLPPDTKDQAKAIFGSLTLASSGWPVGSPTRNAINLAYQETMTNILIVAVCISAPLIPLSLCMKNYRLDEMDQGVKGVVFGGHRDGTDERDEGLFSRLSSPNDSDGEDGAGTPSPSPRRSLMERFRGKQA